MWLREAGKFGDSGGCVVWGEGVGTYGDIVKKLPILISFVYGNFALSLGDH